MSMFFFFAPFILGRSTAPLAVETLQCNAILFLFGVPVNLEKQGGQAQARYIHETCLLCYG
jgi:hypothetical protein